jgi:hypothetical protein
LRGEGKRVAACVDIKPAAKGLAVALILFRGAQPRLIAPITNRIEEADSMAMADKPYSEVANPHDVPSLSRHEILRGLPLRSREGRSNQAITRAADSQ